MVLGSLVPSQPVSGCGQTLCLPRCGEALQEPPGEVPSLLGSLVPGAATVGSGKGCLHSD